MAKRKPSPSKTTQTAPVVPEAQQRPSAELVLNSFLNKSGILLALGEAQVSRTDDGLVVVGKPNILAVYKDEVAPRKGK